MDQIEGMSGSSCYKSNDFDALQLINKKDWRET